MLIIVIIIIIINYYLPSIISTYCTVINEGSAIEVLIIFKAPICQSDNPERIAVCEDPMRVRTHIVRKIQTLSS